MKITCHCLVKNEENFSWYALNSVIDYVDEILVWDNGSADKTRDILRSIKNPKLKFKDASGLTVVEARQAMLSQTRADWIFIHDGDEIWHADQIGKQIKKIEKDGDKFDVVVNRNKVLIGDMYHYLSESAGKYRIHDRLGHYSIRFIKNLPGLTVEGVYPNEAYMLGGIKVQNLPKARMFFSNNYYLHASFLNRSAIGHGKYKHEIGKRLPRDYFYPEIFFRPAPLLVGSIWMPMTGSYKVLASLVTPLKLLKRKFV